MSFEVIQATVGAFGMFMPNALAVRHYDPRDSRRRMDIRLGMLIAAFWSFVVAAYYSEKEGTSIPYVYWLGGVALMVTLYEVMLRDERDIDLGNYPSTR